MTHLLGNISHMCCGLGYSCWSRVTGQGKGRERMSLPAFEDDSQIDLTDVFRISNNVSDGNRNGKGDLICWSASPPLSYNWDVLRKSIKGSCITKSTLQRREMIKRLSEIFPRSCRFVLRLSCFEISSGYRYARFSDKFGSEGAFFLCNPPYQVPNGDSTRFPKTNRQNATDRPR